MKKLSLFFSGIFFVITLGFYLKAQYVNPYSLVCDLVDAKFYLKNDKLLKFKNECDRVAQKVNLGTPEKDIIYALNRQFEILESSHLKVYSGSENDEVWMNESESTGLHAEWIEGQLVITEIDSQSAADNKEIEKGDIVLSLNDQAVDEFIVEKQFGNYKIQKLKKIIEVKLVEKKYLKDNSPQIKKLSPEIVYLKIPSFKKDSFSKEKLQTLTKSIQNYHKIILDLRGNSGGNFVAGLRLLSLFLCAEKEIGSLKKQIVKQTGPFYLKDDLDESVQIQQMKNDLVRLKTFSNYDCWSQPIVVLVNRESASTAEMVAQALRDYRGAQLVGEATAGAMLQGVWYDLPEIGRHVSISIPEALYQTQQGLILEGKGVRDVKQLKEKRLQDFRNGQDSWVLQSLDYF